MIHGPVIQERDCEICGYQLRGMPKHALSVCPECGSVFDAQRASSIWRYASWAVVPACIAVILGSLKLSPHDKFGVPTEVIALIAIFLAMCAIVVFSLISAAMSTTPSNVVSRWLLGLGLGCVICILSLCMGRCATI